MPTPSLQENVQLLENLKYLNFLNEHQDGFGIQSKPCGEYIHYEKYTDAWEAIEEYAHNNGGTLPQTIHVKLTHCRLNLESTLLRRDPVFLLAPDGQLIWALPEDAPRVMDSFLEAVDEGAPISHNIKLPKITAPVLQAYFKYCAKNHKS